MVSGAHFEPQLDELIALLEKLEGNWGDEVSTLGLSNSLVDLVLPTARQ